jgi:hypothetical protein
MMNSEDLLTKHKQTRQRPTQKHLTFDEIAKYFDVPITSAAKSLNVSETYLKKVSRELDIPRWPYRKLSSLQKRLDILEKMYIKHGGSQVPDNIVKEIIDIKTEMKNIKENPAILLSNAMESHERSVSTSSELESYVDSPTSSIVMGQPFTAFDSPVTLISIPSLSMIIGQQKSISKVRFSPYPTTNIPQPVQNLHNIHVQAQQTNRNIATQSPVSSLYPKMTTSSPTTTQNQQSLNLRLDYDELFRELQRRDNNET